MTSRPKIGFEHDILEQGAALSTYASEPLPQFLVTLDFGRFDRIIFTGMGSSDYVSLGIELALARKGLPVWRIQTSHLLQALEWITPRTLLWVTSQSGKSGEVVALLSKLVDHPHGPIVGVTNNPESPLGRVCDHLIFLHSGSEATVSTKSYINTLAALHRVHAGMDGLSDAAAVKQLSDLVPDVNAATATMPDFIQNLAQRAMATERPRFALIGSGQDAITALTGALIMKEACKVAAEGYIGGAFRHGPLEIAGKGLTALLFCSDEEDITMSTLAKDLSATGAIVVVVGPRGLEGAEHFKVPARPDVARLALAMIFIQHLSVALARIGGYVPGDFIYGQKITAQI